MNSPFASIFLAMQQQIKASLPAIRYIDQDLGQLRGKVRPPVSWPCVLIDFEHFSFENMGENVQTVAGTVTVQLGFAPYSQSAQITPPAYVEQALGYYELEWSLHLLLQGWSPGDDYGHLCRASVATQQRTDGYRVRELRYSLAFEDYSTQYGRRLAPASPVIADQIQI